MHRVLLLCALVWTTLSWAQCLPANPSFEVEGATPALLPGWQVEGDGAAHGVALHGHVALRLRGGQGMSSCWQELAAAPGQVWSATGSVRPAFAPGPASQSRGVVILEWRSAGGALLSSQLAQVAQAEMPVGQWSSFTMEAGPAPLGTARVRLVLGLEQDPADASWELAWDSVDLQDAEAMHQAQWADFPGGRELQFSGRAWRVKGPGWYGPGSNYFSNDAEQILVDDEDRLHLRIRQVAGQWWCGEVALEEALGYGDYLFTTRGALDQLDPRVVLGLFLWQYAPCWNAGDAWWNPYNEIDVEFSRWGNPADMVGQFVAQPWDWAGNRVRFNATFGVDEVATHAFRWSPDQVEFRSWRGGPLDEELGEPVFAWTYAGPHVPRLEQPRVHLNLWLAGGVPAGPQEVVLESFTFIPLEDENALSPPDGSAPARPRALELVAAPNPFNNLVRLGYRLDRAASCMLDIHRLDGARVRRLRLGMTGPGSHVSAWDGRDDAGRELPSGLYLVRLHTADSQAVQRVLLVK